MNPKTYKTLETPSGNGELCVAGKHLAKVFYQLHVRQEIPNGTPAVPPLSGPEITGEITVSQDEPMQTQVLRRVGGGELLTLYLGDGRHVEVYATPSTTEADTDAYKIVPATPAGFISDN